MGIESKKEKFICKHCGNEFETEYEITKDYANWKCDNCYEMAHRPGFIGTKFIWKTDTGTVKRNK